MTIAVRPRRPASRGARPFAVLGALAAALATVAALAPSAGAGAALPAPAQAAPSDLNSIGGAATGSTSTGGDQNAGTANGSTADESASGGAVRAPASGAIFGAASWDPSTNAGITGLEKKVGRTMAVHRVYSMWDTPQPTSAVRADVAAGRLPLLSITPKLSSGTKLLWGSVANGHRDATIRAQARGLKSLGKPVLLVFHHEADLQSSGYGTAAQFGAAFRHYAQVIRSSGASNVSMVVVLSPYTYATTISQWYPGDDVVNWIGADAYNFGACSPGRPAWRSLEQAAGKFYSWGASRHKPLVLAEWGSAEDKNAPGRKAQWITDAGRTMRAWTQLKAVSYFDQPGSCDWRVGTSSSSLQAFKDLARSSWAQN